MNNYNQNLIKGMTTELYCAMKFIEYGFIVSIPYGDNNRYDMIIDDGNKMYRIQIKSASKNNSNAYVVQTCNKVSTTYKTETKHYTRDQIDFIVTVIENQLVVIPMDMVEYSTSRTFRTELPKYGAKGKCNLIQDFTVEKYLLDGE